MSQHLLLWKWLPLIPNTTNRPYVSNRQVNAASIRIDDPNPDIELVETGLPGADPNAGKFEIAVQADQLQINGRNADVGPNKGFETIVVSTRPAAGGISVADSRKVIIRNLEEETCNRYHKRLRRSDTQYR